MKFVHYNSIYRKELFVLRPGRQLALPQFARFCNEKKFVIVGEKGKTKHRIYWKRGHVTDVDYFEYFPKERLVIYVLTTPFGKEKTVITHLSRGEGISFTPVD